MGFLGWVADPLIAPAVDQTLGMKGITRFLLMTVGLMWQFVLAMMVVYGEAKSLSLSTIKERLWLNVPRAPRSGQRRRILWLWLLPFAVLFPVFDFEVSRIPNRLWVSVLPFLAQPPGYSFSAMTSAPEVRAQLVGAWWFFGLFLVSATFNTILGEEFLFRGVLLPRMNAVFGKWDWVANGILFGAYHVHQPWGIPGGVLTSVFLFALPAKLFRSTWMSIIVHSGQSVFFGIVVLRLVVG
jgi:membrane protease YdiL (CAAX protease family)